MIPAALQEEFPHGYILVFPVRTVTTFLVITTTVITAMTQLCQLRGDGLCRSLLELAVLPAVRRLYLRRSEPASPQPADTAGL